MTVPGNIKKGTDNLLINCARLQPHESLLIICEDPALGWYDAAAPQAVAAAARELGVTPFILPVGCPQNTPDPAVTAAIAAHDCTIFFSRLGDQDRFGELAPGKRSVMCYIRSLEMLASPYGRSDYGASLAIKEAVNEVLLAAENIEITCPAGTRFSGSATPGARREKADVSVLRFPLGVPLPIDAALFSGRIALARFLTPTGSRCYQPDHIALEGTSFVEISNGRIDRFTGEPGQVARIEQHYNMVAGRFGIDRDIVHSWHAGIHPASSHKASAASNPDRWSNSVFTNPRVVHFHTCGNYAPAEICWMLIDHTITVDGISLWDKGRLKLDAFARTNSCLEQWPGLNELFHNPAREIGLA